ncbi:hypothetical protein [Photorhabdus khanii]|uniref:hypothetical protein n=1 Tax=Photorhabdus khanii TaxID=1004150 RepID=UPI001EFF808D|nr:hypothetical protein [Photorhabdus khanii]
MKWICTAILRADQGMEHMLIILPSAAAVKKHLKRLNSKLTDAQLNQLSKDVAAIIIPAEIHQKLSATDGGRNSPAQIEQDGKDLKAAVNRDFNTIKPELKNYGVTEEQLEKAREKMHEINQKQGLYE